MFVCTGNICRSPTAERLALRLAIEQQISSFSASSAGTHAVVGHRMHDSAARVLTKLGGSSRDFSARQLTKRVAGDADLVLTMTRAHRDAVLELAPSKLHRTYTLAEAATLVTKLDATTPVDLSTLRSLLPATEQMDIIDPIGQTDDVFETVGETILHFLGPVVSMCARSPG